MRYILRIKEESARATPKLRSCHSQAGDHVSIRSDLLAAAGQAGVNLSATLERALADELAVVQRRRWREENREAIHAYDEHIDEHGAFSDDVRKF